MKDSKWNDDDQSDHPEGSTKSRSQIKKNRNLKRLGGGGLSLEAFANAKTKSREYNPSLIKKKREFHKNAKYLKKFKKQVKQPGEQDEGEPEGSKKINKWNKKQKKGGSFSLEAVYAKKHEEVEKERMEREAAIRAVKEQREKAEARRKEQREKFFKKTKKGQPVMKYRIQHLLDTIRRSET